VNFIYGGPEEDDEQVCAVPPSHTRKRSNDKPLAPTRNTVGRGTPGEGRKEGETKRGEHRGAVAIKDRRMVGAWLPFVLMCCNGPPGTDRNRPTKAVSISTLSDTRLIVCPVSCVLCPTRGRVPLGEVGDVY
jgi:hypothetical protein